jgi:hypothetical protein
MQSFYGIAPRTRPGRIRPGARRAYSSRSRGRSFTDARPNSFRNRGVVA